MGVGTEEAFEALVDVYAGAVFVIDSDGRYREVIEGTAGQELLYDDPESLTGETFRDVLPSETANRFHRVVEAVVESDSPSIIEYPLEVQAGQRWFEASVSPIDDGHRDRVLWAARDITERKQYERALTGLQEAGPKLTASGSIEAVCEEGIHAADSILDFDRSMILLEHDGVLQDEATSDRLAPDTPKRIPVDEGVAGHTYRTGESVLMDSIPDSETALDDSSFQSGISVAIGDYGVLQAMANTAGAFDESDLELAELLAGQVAATITRLRHEQTLERQNERLDEFTSIVSHDLRNPLAVASGRLELAAEECDSEHLDHVADAHERMQGLIEDLLTLARTSDEEPTVEPVDVGQIARDCWTILDSRNASLNVEADGEILANQTQLRQLLENLLGNAIEHGTPSSRSDMTDDVDSESTDSPSGSGEDAVEHESDDLTITVDSHEDGFFVADDGNGITESDPERLFEAGYSGDDGTGLGLHIVQTIAESHDWEVDSCESADGGARFEITGVERP